jgi:hypothetical protein
MDSDQRLADLVRRKLEKLDGDWVTEAQRLLTRGIRKASALIEKAETVKDLHQVTGTLHIVADKLIAFQALTNGRPVQTHPQDPGNAAHAGAVERGAERPGERAPMH